MRRPICSCVALAMASCLLTTACAFSIKVGQLPSAKTDLEQQVLGTYQEIDDELVLISTVRGDAEPTATELSSKVKLARDNQKFNLDDIEELKNAQILGEKADGTLAAIPPQVTRLATSPSEAQLRLADILLREENSDRSVIWEEIIARQSNLSQDNLGEVGRTYAALKRKECQAGQWYQDDSGQWIRKINEK